jgi:nucleotide-binding universal stress UspA family protein
METILIATDFSSASRNASLYGTELAKALNAKIILCNAYTVSQPGGALNVSISRYDIKMQTDKKLLDEAEVLDPTREMIEIICDEGVAEDVIINIANEKKVNFIITGMKGSSNNLKKIFGSTATSIIKISNIPVIVVPEKAAFSIPKVILYASDMTPGSNIEHIEQIKPITDTFESKVYLVKVVKDEHEQGFEQYTPGRVKEELKKLNVSLQYPVDTDIRHALNEFISEHHVDILVMIPHKHDWLERIFRKSETKDMIFHTRVPVMVIPEIHAGTQLLI